MQIKPVMMGFDRESDRRGGPTDLNSPNISFSRDAFRVTGES